MKTILIADDHEITRRGLRELVIELLQDAEIFEAASGPEVLRLLPHNAWDLVLLDVMMPETNPSTLVAEVRRTLPQTPILMLTAATEPEYAAETMRLGANGLVHKHRASSELAEAIRVVMGGGAYLHPDTAVEVAMLARSPAPPHASLSPRELEVLQAVASGKSVKEVAAALEISDKTVATYLARIKEKTGLSSLVEITRYAFQQGLAR